MSEINHVFYVHSFQNNEVFLKLRHVRAVKYVFTLTVLPKSRCAEEIWDLRGFATKRVTHVKIIHELKNKHSIIFRIIPETIMRSILLLSSSSHHKKNCVVLVFFVRCLVASKPRMSRRLANLQLIFLMFL